MKRLLIALLLPALIILSSCREEEKYTKEAIDLLESVIESTEDMPDVWDEDKGLLINSHHTINELISAIESAKGAEDVTGYAFDMPYEEPFLIGSYPIGTASYFHYIYSDDKPIMIYYNDEFVNYFKTYVNEMKRGQ